MIYVRYIFLSCVHLDIAEILLKLALNTNQLINQSINQFCCSRVVGIYREASCAYDTAVAVLSMNLLLLVLKEISWTEPSC